MTRLKYYRTHLDYPEDVKRICRYVTELESYAEAQFLWREYSTYLYCAGWIEVSEETLKEFHQWILEEYGNENTL